MCVFACSTAPDVKVALATSSSISTTVQSYNYLMQQNALTAAPGKWGCSKLN